MQCKAFARRNNYVTSACLLTELDPLLDHGLCLPHMLLLTYELQDLLSIITVN